MITPLTHCLKCPARIVPNIGSHFHRSYLPKVLTFQQLKPNLTFIPSKNLHITKRNLAKLFVDRENAYAYTVLPEIKKFEPTWNCPTKITTITEFNQFLDQDWRSSNATAIVHAFEKVKDISVLNSLPLSDHRFDKLVDGLMDHCEKLTDEELFRLLCTLTEYTPCETSDSHNFHDVWSCLDDICCWKMWNWNSQKLYSFAEIWYKWNLARLSDFMFETLDKITSRPSRLSKNMLVYTFFYLNVHRRRSFPFELEQALVAKLDEFSIDELAIIAMGYFKTSTKIKTPALIQAMINAISNNCASINEISLTAMLKVIRFSQKAETAPDIPPMLDKLTEQLPRFSPMALIHVALTGTSLLIKHESVRKCAERIVEEISTIRMKDIERILGACSVFDIDTTPSIFEKSLKEIQKESRKAEIVKYSRSLPSTLYYLSLRKFYCYPLMHEQLDEEFINETFGKSPKLVPRDLFSLDASIDIECPDYTGNRLSPNKKYRAVKYLTEFTPTPDQPKRLSLSDKFYLGVAEAVASIVGDEKLIHHDHVLPHFSKSDMILCKEKSSGHFVKPAGFENYCLGDVMRPVDLQKYTWYAVVVMTPNLVLRDTCLPVGMMIMKERQLKAIGYTPILIYVNQFNDKSDAANYLKTRLS